MRLLIIQDDYDYQNLLELGMSERSSEFDYMFCDDCLEADDVIESFKPDVIVLDLFSSSQCLNFIQKNHNRVIVATSPKYDPKLETKALAHGACGYFPRVCDADTVGFVLDQIKSIRFRTSEIH
jgi:DNA-binding response OmpR family regulator